MVGISKAFVMNILQNSLKFKKMCVPHLLTEEQKRTRVKMACTLLKRFPRYDQKKKYECSDR